MTWRTTCQSSQLRTKWMCTIYPGKNHSSFDYGKHSFFSKWIKLHTCFYFRIFHLFLSTDKYLKAFESPMPFTKSSSFPVDLKDENWEKQCWQVSVDKWNQPLLSSMTPGMTALNNHLALGVNVFRSGSFGVCSLGNYIWHVDYIL